MDMIRTLAQELGIKTGQAEAAVKLIDEGNTIPFIARYRKEVTGALNDEVLRNLYERLNYLRNLEEKKEQVIGSIEEQGKLTPELKKQILEAQTLVAVDDLPSVSSETKNPCHYCKRTWSGTAGKYPEPAADCENDGRRSESLY